MQLQHQKITLDVNDTRAFTVLNAHQGDSKTRFIDITLTENGNTITLSSSYVATVKASINNKTKAVNTAVVNTINNVITVELTKIMLDTPGLLNCEVILQEGQQFVTSATFTVKVAESVISDESEIVASQEFGKLIDALIEIKDIEDKADRVQTLVDNIDKLESANDIVTRLNNVESKETQLETQHKTDVQALTDKANSIVNQANTDRQNFNNSVDEINTTLDTKENGSNKVSEITHPSLDYYPDTKAVFDYVNSKLETPLSDIESLKAGKLDKTDFNTYKTATDKAVADNTKSIKANTTAIDKCVTDIANNSALISKNQINVTTDKSTSIVINDSSDCNIVNLTAYGNSTQSEVPTPTAPVSINDISGVNLYAYGKNLLDFDNTAFSKFKISEITVDKENKSVSFVSNNDDLSGFFIRNMFINKGLKGNITTSLTITSDTDCQVHFRASSADQGLKTISAGSTRLQVQGSIELGKDFWVYVKGHNHSITVSDIQIELGDTATEYEDFNNVQTIKISDVVLRSVDNVCDKIIINKNGDGYIERNIGVINLKNIPKEQWMKSGQNVDRYYAPLAISYNIQDYSKLLCTHFKKESNNDGEAIGKITSNSTNIGFAFAEKDTTSMEDWVSFINNNDVLLYYILSTPTVTQLTQEQVNNVLNIKTNYQNTTILSNCDFQLSYVADTKHYIDNKFNELATALVAHESEVM